MAKREHVERQAVFLNIPYDEAFTSIYLAYMVAVSSLGFVPRATVGIHGTTRLQRIAELIKTCEFSIHDLSRVQIDRNPPATPRFNIPFELGLAVAWSWSHPTHRWVVFESKERRIQKSLNDLNGTDVFIHGGAIEGVMREMCNAFEGPVKQPTVPEMMRIYRKLRTTLPEIQRNTGSRSLFTRRSFDDLSLATAGLVTKHVLS